MTPASQIAHYKITSKLGEGGMGAVYRATDTKLHRDVAIKVLPEAFAADTARMARFEREAQMLAALNHPNIAAVYGIEQGAIVMELVEGENLKGPIPVETAIHYARQMVIALEAAHEKGIIHRDLKPANIKVTQNGTVKLLDFGLAKVSEEAVSSAGTSPTVSPTLTLAMTQDGAILGTAAYMSPEQARGKAVDKCADIWAFGVVLFEVLSGAPLFGGGQTVTDTIASVMKEEPDWKALPEETPAHIRRLLKLCLRKDPKKRLQAIVDVRLLLDEPDEVLAVQAAASPASGRPGHWLPWAITGLVVVATAVAAGTMWLRPKPVNVGKARFALAIPEGNTDSRYRAATQAVPSPDGRNIAFVAEDKAGKSNLWVRPLESVVPHKLDKTEDANYPFWSPDGQFIAFFAEGKLKRIALSGGSPQTLCEVAVSGPVIDFLPGDGGAWSRKGVIVFATGGSALMRVRASGEGVATPASTLNASESAHSWPQFLPDGQHVLYLARATDG